MEIKHNTPLHLNAEQFHLKLNFCWASLRDSWRRSINAVCTYHIYRTKSTGFDYTGVLQLLRPPGLLQCDCWRKPDLDPVHQPLIVQTSHLNTLPGGRWEPCCATDQISPSTHLISSPLPRFGCAVVRIKASSCTLLSICPNLPRSDLSPADITIWAETWPKYSQLLI